MVAIDLETTAGRIEALERMVTIRQFEQRVGDLFADGQIEGSSVHLCIGQEATAVGACAAINPDDYITSTHRGHGHSIAKGLEPKRMLAELYGSNEGYCKGKGGSMHIADIDAGMLGANGIVGAGPPLATGAALTAQLLDTERIALSFIGDGAVAQGQVHEAINLAATWNLPLIILVENNQFGEGTPLEKQHNIDTLSDMAAAYDIPGMTIDGMDVMAVFETVVAARDRARQGNGPTFIEAETYRFRGHFEGDPQPYRDEREVDEWRKRDPIDAFATQLIEWDDLTEAEFQVIQSETEELIEAAIDDGAAAPAAAPEEAYDDMWADPVPELHRFTGQLLADGTGVGGEPR